jgi:hypothetical protein
MVPAMVVPVSFMVLLMVFFGLDLLGLGLARRSPGCRLRLRQQRCEAKSSQDEG